MINTVLCVVIQERKILKLFVNPGDSLDGCVPLTATERSMMKGEREGGEGRKEERKETSEEGRPEGRAG